MLVIGDYVKLKNENIEGEIIKINKDKVTLVSNGKNVRANIDNIVKIGSQKKRETKVEIKMQISSPPNDTIMIRHQTANEALSNLEKFIDNAICNNIKIVKIIHGKQGGVLRKEVHKFLENNPNVKEHRLGGYYEGGYGVTIAFLK